MMKEKYLVFTGFVGGYGGIAKAKRFIVGLQERGINPILVTEEKYRINLIKFGLRPDVTIPVRDRIKDNYAEVARSLDPVDYDTMISFGPRTFGPKHAVDTGRKAIIIDGGLPPFPDTKGDKNWKGPREEACFKGTKGAFQCSL